MIIDTHTHFYDPERPEGVPWPNRDSPLFRAVLPDEFYACAEPCGVTRTVVVEASGWIEDNEWLLRLARSEPRITGVIGRLDPGEIGFPANLERFASDRLFRGIRLNGGVVTGAMQASSFRTHLCELAHRRLALELNAGPALLDHVLAETEALPDLPIIVDHMAGSDRPDGRPTVDLLDRLRRLSERPNLYCKLSGFVEAASRHHDPVPSDPEYYRPMFDALLEVIGPERLLYASNWPVSELMAPYATVFGVLETWIGEQAPAAQKLMWRENAVTAYGLQE